MKRTGFKPKVYERPPRQPLRASAEFRYAAPQVAALFKPIEKHVYIRSTALMALYRLPPCQWCGSFHSVCGAHSNWAIHGKGKSVKADDTRAASLCIRCHRDLDQGSTLSDGERKSMWWAAHVRTIRWIVERKLWPAGVPIPSLEMPGEWL